jgi:hypothetical protein
MKKDEILYSLTVEDVQFEAMEQIGRELTEDELREFQDRLSDGIGENMSGIWNALFEEYKIL